MTLYCKVLGMSEDISGTLHELERVRRATRVDLQGFWFPLVLFGGLVLVSVPLVRTDDSAPAVFWAIAGPAGGAAVGWYYHRHELRVGVVRSGAPYVLVTAGLMAGAFLLPALTAGRLQEVASAFAVAAGYFAFAALERSWVVAAVAACVAVVAGAALASGVDHPGVYAWTVIGLVMVGTGFALRRARTTA